MTQGSLADVVDVLNAQYPPETAEGWDAVGLVCGQPSDGVTRVLFAVDPHPLVVAEALDWGADLVITHHPLLLTPVHGVSDGWRGDVLHRLIRSNTGLFCAHTNADVAQAGVNDALTAALGIEDTRPLDPSSNLGRIGSLAQPMTLDAFATRVLSALPATSGGIRISGDPTLPVSAVAVCGGAGGSLVDLARETGADVYVTADLRHHRSADAACDGGPALIDASHWATEWPWLPVAAERLVAGLAERGITVEARVSEIVTDPWTEHRPSTS